MSTKNEYKPRSIVIGGTKFKILYKKIENFGELHFDERQIFLRKDLKAEELFDTLMHEVVHATLSLSGLTYILDDEKQEEATVRIIEHFLFPVFKKEYNFYQKSIDLAKK
jgi:hypothetical protein